MSNLQQQLSHLINTKTKPLGALGLLEDIALQAGIIQQTTNPSIQQPHIVVFAADHGIAATGLVNPYPQVVTAQMVLNFLSGGAAINVFCRQHDIGLTIVDAGVNHFFEEYLFNKDFIHLKMAMGTKDYRETNAMSSEEAINAIENGKAIIQKISASGCNCIGFGEMGIANTSSASLIMSAITGIPLAQCVGRGTGANDAQLQTKLYTLQKVYEHHHLDILQGNAIELLSKTGGFEIAMITGAFLQAAAEKMIIVVDGFITTAALLLARLINPGVIDYCIFAHTSGESGHTRMLEYLNATPLLNLGMRLGEGTGAALAIPLIKSAVLFLNEMASFETANVSNATA